MSAEILETVIPILAVNMLHIRNQAGGTFRL